MKLRGKEKFFWERNFNIKSARDIPEVIDGIKGIDSDHDDEFFFFLTSRVQHVGKIHLRCTNLTDTGVKYISTIKNLKELTLKDHNQLTKACLEDINKLADLEYLDISSNDFSIEDILQLTNLKKLKHLIISVSVQDDNMGGSLIRLKNQFAGCDITIY